MALQGGIFHPAYLSHIIIMKSKEQAKKSMQYIIIAGLFLLAVLLATQYLHNNYVSREEYTQLGENYVKLYHYYDEVTAENEQLRASKQLRDSIPNASSINNTINKIAVKKPTAKGEPVELRKCTLENSYPEQHYINPRHPKIIALAQKLKGKDFEESLGNVEDWIYANMQYKYYYGSRTIDQVMMDGQGDCSEYSMLFVSLMKAMGYNRSYVVIAYTNDWELNKWSNFVGHAYAVTFYNHSAYYFYKVKEYNVLKEMYNDEVAYKC